MKGTGDGPVKEATRPQEPAQSIPEMDRRALIRKLMAIPAAAIVVTVLASSKAEAY